MKQWLNAFPPVVQQVQNIQVFLGRCSNCTVQRVCGGRQQQLLTWHDDRTSFLRRSRCIKDTGDSVKLM